MDGLRDQKKWGLTIGGTTGSCPANNPNFPRLPTQSFTMPVEDRIAIPNNVAICSNRPQRIDASTASAKEKLGHSRRERLKFVVLEMRDPFSRDWCFEDTSRLLVQVIEPPIQPSQRKA